MSASSSDLLSALDALSPLDGRYRAASAPLRGLLTEGGLIRERVRIEALWLLHLAAAVPLLPGAQLTPAVRERARQLASAPALAHRYADAAMPARTHGQPASPTTLGKELANFVARLRRAQRRWAAVSILGKWNGAVGNFNAHAAALPAVDWPAVAQAFVTSLSLEYNPWTTQIEPHDWIGEYCDALAGANV